MREYATNRPLHRSFKHNSLIIALAVSLGLSAVLTYWTFFSALDPSTTACYTPSVLHTGK